MLRKVMIVLPAHNKEECINKQHHHKTDNSQ